MWEVISASMVVGFASGSCIKYPWFRTKSIEFYQKFSMQHLTLALLKNNTMRISETLKTPLIDFIISRVIAQNENCWNFI